MIRLIMYITYGYCMRSESYIVVLFNVYISFYYFLDIYISGAEKYI